SFSRVPASFGHLSLLSGTPSPSVSLISGGGGGGGGAGPPKVKPKPSMNSQSSEKLSFCVLGTPTARASRRRCTTSVKKYLAPTPPWNVKSVSFLIALYAVPPSVEATH